MTLLERAGPYGQGNPQPRFAFPAHRVRFAKVVGEVAHGPLVGNVPRQTDAAANAAEGEAAVQPVPLSDLVNVNNQGRCAITLDPKGRKPGQQPYQGIVPLFGDRHEKLEKLSEVIEHYMLQSEQLDTRLVLAANDQVAAGLLIQRLPLQGEANLAGSGVVRSDEDHIGRNEDYNRIAILAASLQRAEAVGQAGHADLAAGGAVDHAVPARLPRAGDQPVSLPDPAQHHDLAGLEHGLGADIHARGLLRRHAPDLPLHGLRLLRLPRQGRRGRPFERLSLMGAPDGSPAPEPGVASKRRAASPRSPTRVRSRRR